MAWAIVPGSHPLAVTQLQWLVVDCSRVQTDDPELCAAADRVQSRCKALLTYLSNNMGSLCDYGARYRSDFRSPLHVLKAVLTILPIREWARNGVCAGHPVERTAWP